MADRAIKLERQADDDGVGGLAAGELGDRGGVGRVTAAREHRARAGDHSAWVADGDADRLATHVETQCPHVRAGV